MTNVQSREVEAWSYVITSLPVILCDEVMLKMTPSPWRPFVGI
jgi:hypothetical protein